MLISKHGIIAKQSGFARGPPSRLSRKIVAKALAALGSYNSLLFQGAGSSVPRNEVMIYSMPSKPSVVIDIENFKISWGKIGETFRLGTGAISSDMRYRIVIAMSSLKTSSGFARWRKRVSLLNTILQIT